MMEWSVVGVTLKGRGGKEETKALIGSVRVDLGQEELLHDPNLTWTDWGHDSGPRVNSSFERLCVEFHQ